MATTLTKMRRAIKAKVAISKDIGKHSHDVNAALSGEHTKERYSKLNKKEAGTLARLRTGMARINGYLHWIRVSDSDQCNYRAAKRYI